MSGDLFEELAARSAMPPSAWGEMEGIPAHTSWPELRRRFIDAIRLHFEQWIASDQGHYGQQLLFAVGRFDEGARLVSHLRQHILPPGPATVLDIGAGNGGISLAFANDRQNHVIAVDYVPNQQAATCRRLLASPLVQIASDGGSLPIASNQIDLVLLVDVLEHLANPRAVAAEIMRVLRPGGLCFIATPARLSYAFRRDPHYGVHSLVLLPNETQRFIVDRILRRRVISSTGGRAKAYDVEHIYWHAAEIAALFSGDKTVDTLYQRSYQPPGRFSRYWIRHPSVAVEQLRYELRRFFFGHILVYKGRPPEGTPRFDRIEPS